MSGLRAHLAARLLATDFEAWNNPRRAKRLLPVFIVLGGMLGILLQLYSPVESLPLPVVWTGVALAGILLLAIIDSAALNQRSSSAERH
jgi:hypothetical protein